MTNPVFRKIDPDAVLRVKAGVRVKPEPVKRQKPRRSIASYRAARRNERRVRRAAQLAAKRSLAHVD